MADVNVIGNAWICSIQKDEVVPVFGEIHISDGVIEKIIEKKKYKAKNPRNFFNAGGRVITIPQVNFHDHIYSRLAKGLKINGKMNSFNKILSNFWWKVDKTLTKEMITASAKMAAIESIKNGVTYIFDHHSSPNYDKKSLTLIANVLKKNYLRGVLCFEISDRNGRDKSISGINENFDFINSVKNDSDIKAMLGMHASFTLSDRTLQLIQTKMKNLEIGTHIHIAEDDVDVSLSLKKYKVTPIDRLIKFNLINEKSILAHGVHLSVRDFKKIKKFNPAIAINIESNMNNSVGLHNFISIPKKISLLCGTDGMHANPSVTMRLYFQMLRFQGLSFSEAFERIRGMYFNQILFAKKYFADFSLLNIRDRADFIVWDYIPPTPVTSSNFWGHFVYGMLNRNIDSVFQSGKLLMKEKKLTLLNEEKEGQKIFSAGKKIYEYFNKRG